jgi:hypothetical protein
LAGHVWISQVFFDNFYRIMIDYVWETVRLGDPEGGRLTHFPAVCG